MATTTELDAELESLTVDAAEIASRIDEYSEVIEAIEDAVSEARKAHSGSWLGYHSRVYYNGLQPPPPGAVFDPASGLRERFCNDTRGDWAEFSYDKIYDGLKSVVDESSFDGMAEVAGAARPTVVEIREKLISLLTAIKERAENQYIEKLLKDAQNAKIFSTKDFVDYYRPSGQFMSRDTAAIHNGLQTPPHIALYSVVQALQSPFNVANQLSKIAARAKEHILHRKSSTAHATSGGGHVFIGHGRSSAWRETYRRPHPRAAGCGAARGPASGP